MADATYPTIAATTSPLTSSRSANFSMSLGKRRHGEISKDVSKPAERTFSTPSLPSPIVGDLSTLSTPASRRSTLTLTPINTSPVISAGSSTFQPPTPSPAPTEIAPDVEQIEMTAQDHVATLLAEGIKVRDFIHEPVPNSCKAPELFDPVPSLIATDWHMRNPQKNHGLLSGKSLFRLVKIGWLSMDEVERRVHGRELSALTKYSERLEEERYPFVVVPPPNNGQMPTPSQRVRMRRNAGFQSRPDDVPDREFFGYDPTGHSDEEGDHHSIPPEAEEVGTKTEERQTKRRKVKAKAKPLHRAKPLRRKCSRPEV
jgi:hypothetical protein